MKRLWSDQAVRTGLIVFIIIRLWLTLWAGVVTAIIPVPTSPDETLRPYLGATQLNEGVGGVLLGPWQRFDTLHYLRIAREGYTVPDSVFPPIYPWLIHSLGWVLGENTVGYLIAALLISNLAVLGLLIFLFRMISIEFGNSVATRTIIYLALFPTGFFLWAGYTESLFLLLAAATIWSARNGRFWLAGGIGLVASLTRLTGWILAIPLAYEIGRDLYGKYRTRRPQINSSELNHYFLTALPAALPPLGFLIFLIYRAWLGFPPLTMVYQQYWYQTTGFPGSDTVKALQTLFFNGTARSNELISLWLDFACLILLLVTTVLVFRRLGTTFGLYSAMLLLFMLLPISDVKPLYSFSRYTLAFFPTFILLGQWGQNQWVHRLILYSSLILWLFFSGQFFVWGWVG